MLHWNFVNIQVDQANINQLSMIDDLDDLVKENRKLKEELDTKESKE